MRYAHFVEMRVFSREGEDEEGIISKIKMLFPLDFKEEKIAIDLRSAEGFENKRIHILKVNISKERHIRPVLENLFTRLSQEDRSTLLSQLESRLDSNLHFFMRLDKDELLQDRYLLTETGNCFHMTIAIAAYPHSREIAREIIKRLCSLSFIEPEN
ncbi:MAG: hypothetical protein HGA85_01900 [Nanoarchaeota archaeon]|nr:hypothetical protein [Nanoarchaeota archaeon]